MSFKTAQIMCFISNFSVFAEFITIESSLNASFYLAEHDLSPLTAFVRTRSLFVTLVLLITSSVCGPKADGTRGFPRVLCLCIHRWKLECKLSVFSV